MAKPADGNAVCSLRLHTLEQRTFVHGHLLGEG